ncbi:2-hydroxyacyl-CoA dehydratase subunit D [Desulfomonile tiedjei]|uniref:Benzoyl-CoA reductase/2-hydroxyglutaryl-CoA dehydratase subunit, BcrC/BadD/HgdB n=1 Tax=Desulfomonile tiedjei (strain ATCC 49306 / DSM 6799 / DCB-1) TaxID=706587 RepID=I4C3U5_DESTA|nr:2-hydroxyacyl-CoA dehydratase family protein [Desulfomonile tiedjei]AFM24236.1 Benzoyl-CoA reductase/2-hydroxyglutaryl-CoA dehydratase subunit, BcrC/BadD/HgdB [Desulfomonile tiedjei DSM 6799]
MQPIEALKQLKQINIDYYGGAHAARQNNKFIAYVNAFTPVELLYAMDVIPIYPENHAVIIGARKMSTEVAAAAEGMGYSMDLCSYARCDLGSIKTGLSPTWGLPKPDLLLISNSQCGTLTKWFEVLSRLYNVPMFLIDVPHSGHGEPDPAGERYVRTQLEDLILLLERITGKSLDRNRLTEAIRLSKEASDLWTRVLESGMHRPAPITVFDQFISMAPIVAQRGTQVAVDFYRDLAAELQARVDQGIGACENERFRLFWDNLPIWPELRRLSLFLEERGGSLVTSLYTWAWARLAVGEEDPLTDWTNQYLYLANLHLGKRIDDYLEIAAKYQLDGFLYHSNRSCKFVSQDIPEVRRAITERSGIPGLILEADHNDPRLYTIESLESQIDNFLELLASRKQSAR